jgi:hypothetical protein
MLLPTARGVHPLNADLLHPLRLKTLLLLEEEVLMHLPAKQLSRNLPVLSNRDAE